VSAWSLSGGQADIRRIIVALVERKVFEGISFARRLNSNYNERHASFALPKGVNGAGEAVPRTFFPKAVQWHGKSGQLVFLAFASIPEGAWI
jgi:hypothetical protein